MVIQPILAAEFTALRDFPPREPNRYKKLGSTLSAYQTGEKISNNEELIGLDVDVLVLSGARRCCDE